MSEEEKVETTEEPKPEWDKTRQQIDQLSSNLKGALNDNKTLKDGITELNEKLNTLEQSLKVNQTPKVEIAELDPMRADVPDVVNQNRQLADYIQKQNERIKTLEALGAEFKEREQKREAEQQQKSTIERILKPLDERYGAKYRNDAKKLADEKVDSGQVPQPKDSLEARDLLEQCYQEVKAGEKNLQVMHGVRRNRQPAGEEVK